MSELRAQITATCLTLGVMLSVITPTQSAFAKPCGLVEGSELCLGQIDPRGKLSSAEREMLDNAAKLAIETLSSARFKTALSENLEMVMRQPRNDSGWQSAQESFEGRTAEQLIQELLAEIDGMQVDSFGYTKGTVYWWLFGTKATDGNIDGPMLLNRAALYKATERSIANTLVHEAAHRIGLSHKNKDACEAPYLIGDLLQTQIDPNFELPCEYEV